MVDEVDKANEQLEKSIENTLKNIDTTIPKNNTGKCLSCGLDVKDERRWCSADCRDNYEKNQ
tara:strand:- start:464 stop:649 length:186 start_codon:yes stop_codon:yes gene_type:complete